MNPKVQDFIRSHQFPNEVFKPVKDFEGRFWISNHGSIVSHDHRKNTIAFLSPHLDSLGYYTTQLRMKPVNRRCRVHQLVGEHFCPMMETGDRMCWNHKDGNKRNNLYTNLEYITMRDNCGHAVSSGLHDLKGSKHPNSKLSTDQVLQMRELRRKGFIYKDIADKFGVTRRQASDVIRGVNWGWLS